MSVLGDDEMMRAKEWAGRHPGWVLMPPAYIGQLGSSEFECWRLAHLTSRHRVANADLGLLFDEMDAWCASGWCGVEACDGQPQPGAVVTSATDR